MIASGLMAAVFLAVYLILNSGLRFYRLNSDTNERQREILSFLSRLNLSMQNTQSSLIFVDGVGAAAVPGPGTTYANSRGIAYAIPFNARNQADFEPTTKKLLWHAYGVYTVYPDGDLRWQRLENAGARTPGAPLTNPPNPAATTPPATPAEQLTGSPRGLLLARKVTGLHFTRHDAGEAIGNGHVLKSTYYEVVVECGKKNDNLGYWIQMRSSFFPRN